MHPDLLEARGGAPGTLGLLGILRVPALQVTQVDGLEGCEWTVWLALGRGPVHSPLLENPDPSALERHGAGRKQKPSQLLQVCPTHSSGWGWGLSPHTPPLGTAHHRTAGCEGPAPHPARLQHTAGLALSSTQASRALCSRCQAKQTFPCPSSTQPLSLPVSLY